MRNILNDRFFINIETERQAYWLGFIAADGNIQYTKKNKCVNIGLAKKDGKHLEKLAIDLEWSGIVRHLQTKSVITVYSKSLVESLITLNICPRKSHSLKPWNGPSSLMKDYWRGVFDGDGGFCRHVKKRKTKSPYTAWSSVLVGTKSITRAFQEFILHQALPPYNKGKISKHSSIWSVSFGGLRPSQSVAKILYQNAAIYLDRKINLANEILSTQLHEHKIASMNTNDLLLQYKTFGNWSKVASHIGVSHNGLYKHIRKLNLPRRKWIQLS